MDIIQAVLMGIIQGLSEFLPISSSAHLVFTSNFYKVFKGIEIVQNSNQEVFLDIMLHVGTLIAVLIYFRKDIAEIVKALYEGIRYKKYDSENFKIGVYITVGTAVTAIIACPLSPIAEDLVFQPSIVGMMLVFTGLALLVSEGISKKIKKGLPIKFKNSFWIAVAQGFASLPGFSRSGLTIAAGLLSGCDRITSARYSFLLSVPIILGASVVYPLVTIDLADAMTYNWKAIMLGTFVSGVVGYVCIKYFLKFVSKFSLNVFGYYCLVIGIITAVYFSFK